MRVLEKHEIEYKLKGKQERITEKWWVDKHKELKQKNTIRTVNNVGEEAAVNIIASWYRKHLKQQLQKKNKEEEEGKQIGKKYGKHIKASQSQLSHREKDKEKKGNKKCEDIAMINSSLRLLANVEGKKYIPYHETWANRKEVNKDYSETSMMPWQPKPSEFTWFKGGGAKLSEDVNQEHWLEERRKQKNALKVS